VDSFHNFNSGNAVCDNVPPAALAREKGDGGKKGTRLKSEVSWSLFSLLDKP
jgi:hypothetical protein